MSPTLLDALDLGPMDIIARTLFWIFLVALLLAVPRWTRTHPNVTELVRLREDVDRLHEQVHALEMTNARTADHIISLGHSTKARTSRAIQRFDLLRSDELLLRFDTED